MAELPDLHHRRADLAQRDGRVTPDDFFYSEQNARLVRNAEEHYRAMLLSPVPRLERAIGVLYRP